MQPLRFLQIARFKRFVEPAIHGWGLGRAGLESARAREAHYGAELLKATIPIVTSPPMASRCIRTDTGLVLDLGRRTTALPRRLLGVE
jgi:hypothetical protein